MDDLQLSGEYPEVHRFHAAWCRGGSRSYRELTKMILSIIEREMKLARPVTKAAIPRPKMRPRKMPMGPITLATHTVPLPKDVGPDDEVPF
jgi:hypothetical protein